MSHRRGPRLLTVLLAVCATAACGGQNIRPISLDESARLQIAAEPLTRQVGVARCTMAVTLNDVPGRALEVLPGPTPEFCLGFKVTSSTLRLPPDELQALVAHGIAHLLLEHSRTSSGPSGSSRALARGYTQSRNFTAQEETSADQHAARLLTAAAGREGCAGLARVLDRAVAESGRWNDWTDQHPLTPARAAAARGLCAERR
jgi:Zn-dependent protease with chaperone function